MNRKCSKVYLWVFVFLISGGLFAFAKPQLTTLAAYLTYKHILGNRFSYAIEYESAANTDFRVLFEQNKSTDKELHVDQQGLAQSCKTHLRGELVVSVLETGDNHFLLSYRLVNSNVMLKINDTDAKEDSDIIAAGLSTDIFAEADIRGRILYVCFNSEIDNISRSVARELLAKTQFVLASDISSFENQWEVQEEAPNGEYMARYEPLSSITTLNGLKIQPGQRAFRKTKLRYLTEEQTKKINQATLQTIIQPEGSLEAVFNVDGGYLESLDGRETEQFFIANRSVANAESSFHLRFIKKEMLQTEELVVMRRASKVCETVENQISLSAQISQEERKRMIQRSALGEETLESLIADLKIAETEGQKINTPLYLKFTALVYIHPESCKFLGELLTTADPNSLTRNVISGALANIGHPQAQEALINAIKKRLDDPVFLIGLIQSFNSVSLPTIQAEETLRALVSASENESVYAVALLVLGDMAKKLASTEPNRANGIVEWILKQISTSVTEEKVRLLILALGNAGSPQALGPLSNYIKHPSPELRAAAALGLRWIEFEEVDSILAMVLSTDPEKIVRMESVYAMSFRKPRSVTLEAQKKALIEDHSERVRLSVLRNLSQVSKEYPEVLSLIKKVANSDPSENVRNAAENMLK